MLNNKVRIISGRLRRRSITFPNRGKVRPTPDRIRETVFSWLGAYIGDATCLDCFSGSGILGFEAISRGAKSVTFIDSDRVIIQYIRKNASVLGVTNFSVEQCSLPSGLEKLQLKPPDIVFIDPPYQSDLVGTTIEALETHHLLKPGALLYVEQSAQSRMTPNRAKFEVLKEKVTKRIAYALFKYIC